jgi:hypothetical protein
VEEKLRGLGRVPGEEKEGQQGYKKDGWMDMINAHVCMYGNITVNPTTLCN